MPRTKQTLLKVRIEQIDALIALIDRAERGERGPSEAPLRLWQDLQLAVEELRALPVSRRRLAVIQADLAAVEQAVRAWSACGYQPSYGLGRRLLQQCRIGLYELLAAAPLPAARAAAVRDLAA